MLFKIINKDSNNSPVINQSTGIVLSSVRGIQGRNIYIPKINELTCETSTPEVKDSVDNFLHIDTSKKIIVKGVYGSTWMKRTKVICNEEEQIVEEVVETKKEEEFIPPILRRWKENQK